MKKQIVKVMEAYYITPFVKCFVVEKPDGFVFIPGQATNVSINLTEWKNELRPFSFTSLEEQDYLEFMIKIYDDHEGGTKMLGRINAGDELILHDVFGSIHFRGAGVFIAGGAGITPFISIFRNLYKNNEMRDNTLLYSISTSKDIIIDAELQIMFKTNFVKLFTRQSIEGFGSSHIDRNFLLKNITDFGQIFYVCGPDAFVESITAHLFDLGATKDNVVFER